MFSRLLSFLSFTWSLVIRSQHRLGFICGTSNSTALASQDDRQHTYRPPGQCARKAIRAEKRPTGITTTPGRATVLIGCGFPLTCISENSMGISNNQRG
ncbi:hypothetical protein BOTBODRAFT_538607 [Botryobasidium botryosum FD-172 SS1]|uniref:Secreted protein n=1 Tax=Botryobasidium botryosum (strain FD-172 SS1) TaxID=930990 RepID=A0A067LZZ4_BOTB1|nr:hypothetical protein BOTBODRAFT_538607 [Botryobasidium botryosum FD-172 SS1]